MTVVFFIGFCRSCKVRDYSEEAQFCSKVAMICYSFCEVKVLPQIVKCLIPLTAKLFSNRLRRAANLLFKPKLTFSRKRVCALI